jgi:hypothetical protein
MRVDHELTTHIHAKKNLRAGKAQTVLAAIPPKIVIGRLAKNPQIGQNNMRRLIASESGMRRVSQDAECEPTVAALIYHDAWGWFRLPVCPEMLHGAQNGTLRTAL